MPLWEILIAGFFLPLFWFGWKWVFRIGAAAAVAKAVSKLTDGAKEKLKGALGDAEV